MQVSTDSVLGRLLAALLSLCVLSAGCVIPAASPRTPGLPDYQASLAGLVRSPALVDVPGGIYNVPAGNLVLAATDLSADAGRWTHAIARVYNSATGEWRWNYEMSYDGSTFVDASGARYDGLDTLADGSPIPGSSWDKLDSSSLRTRGGLRHEFDSQGRLASVFWDFPLAPGVRYDWSPDTLWVMQCFEANACVIPLFRVELGPDGPTHASDERTLLLDATTRRVEYAYEAGRLDTVRTPEDVTRSRPGTRYGYRPVSNLIEAIDSSEGERVAYAWLGGRLAVAAAGGFQHPGHRFGFPQVSLEAPGEWSVVHTYPLGGRTRIHYAEDGRWLSSERLDANELASATYAPGSLRPASLTDFDGTTQTIEVYQDDEPTRVALASGNVLDIVHQPDGIDFGQPGRRAIHETTDSLGLVGRTHYDASGRPIEVENGEGESTTLGYHGGASPQVVTPASGVGIEFRLFGISGRWTRATHAGLPQIDLERKLDAAGNRAVLPAGLQRGGVVETRFDGERRPAEIRVAGLDEAGALTTVESLGITRRSDGRLLGIQRPGGIAEHRFQYDALGRLALECESVPAAPCADATLYGYNAASQVASVDRPNGRREEWDYDAYGRRTHHRAFQDGVLEGERVWAWRQDRPVSISDSLSNEVVLVRYDTAGRVHERIISGVTPQAVRLEYDLRSRVTKELLEVASATVALLAYEYDLADRRVATKQLDGTPGGDSLVATTFVGGRIASVTYGNGLTRTHEYAPETGERVGTVMTDALGAVVEDTEIERTIEAAPSRYQVRSETWSPLAHFGEAYWLNRPGSLATDAGRLGMRVFHYEALEDGTVVGQESYRWDALGRMQDDTDGDSFQYDASSGRLTSAVVGGRAFSRGYDEAGNVDTLDGLEVARNALGRITRIGPASAPVVSLSWDMAGRRRSITLGGVRREFSLFGGAVEYDAETGALGWLHLQEVSIALQGTGERYRHLDFRGNTLLTSDEAGSIVAHRRYQPFGVNAVAGVDGIAAADLSGFAGGSEIPGADLVHLGARLLDPILGLFLGPDPLRNPLALLNPHGYAHGNPVFWWDPDGRQPTPAGSGGGGASNASLAVDLIEIGADGFGDTLIFFSVVAGIEAFRTGAVAAGPVGFFSFGGAAVFLGATGAALKFVASRIRAFKELKDLSERSSESSSSGGQRKELVLTGEVVAEPELTPPDPVGSVVVVPGFSLGFFGFGWFAF
jgi:RHS repeat-associated protein